MPAQDANAVNRPCKLVGNWRIKIDVTQPAPAKVLRVDLLSQQKALVGRQLILVNADNPNDSVLSREPWVLNDAKLPLVQCSADDDTTVESGVTADNGPQADVQDLYLGKGSVTVFFYVYWEDFFDSSNEKGLLNQVFAVRLDKRPRQQVQITAKPGQDVAVRFDNLEPGQHQLFIEEMEAELLSGETVIHYDPTPLKVITFTMPPELGFSK